jgi:hypothetical protein
MKANPTIGDVIEVVFLDHAEGPQTLSFRVFGRLAAKTRLTYVIDCWEPEDASTDDANGFNRHQYSILRKTIKELHILKRK